MSSENQEVLVEYLQNGGALYIEGADVMDDLDGTILGDFLGCEFQHTGAEGEGINALTGQESSFTSSDNFGYPPGGDEDYKIDRLNPGDGSTLFTCNSGYDRVVSYVGTNHRVITSSVVLGAFDEEGFSTRANLMTRYMAFLSGVEGPDIFVTPNPADFGIAYLDYEATLPVSILNYGLDVLNISEISVSGDGFSVVNEAPYEVNAGGRLEIPITFLAGETGIYAGTFTISSNDADEATLDIPLNVEIVVPPDIDVSLEPITVTILPDDETEDLLSIENNGGYDLFYDINIADPENLSYNPPEAPETVETPYMLAKGEFDPRYGDPVTDSFGGPDLYGYSWVDSYEENGPVFEWIDISTMGTNTGLTGDDAQTVIELPFEFPFYGENHSSVALGTNGYITFGTDGTAFTNESIPTAAQPNNFIAPFWDDLNSLGGICYSYHDITASKFIIQYTDWGFYSGDGTVNFQVHLYSNGEIRFYYGEMGGILSSCTVGIENSEGTDGLQVAFNTGYIEDNMAIRISSGPTWITTSAQNGTVEPGGTDEIIFTFNSTGMSEGTYEAVATITSNDPDESPLQIDVVMVVSEDGVDDETLLPYETALGINYPNPFNPTTTIPFELADKEMVTLEIINVLGQQVAMLINDVLPAGEYRVTMNARDASNLTSGIYFYKMQAGDYNATRKMILVK